MADDVLMADQGSSLMLTDRKQENILPAAWEDENEIGPQTWDTENRQRVITTSIFVTSRFRRIHDAKDNP
jgi:hypothetical protein